MHLGQQRIDSHRYRLCGITGAAMISGTNKLHNSIRFVLGMAFANNIAMRLSKEVALATAGMLPWVNVFWPVYSRVYVSCPQESIVSVPLESTTLPPMTPTAVGMLMSLMLLNLRMDGPARHCCRKWCLDKNWYIASMTHRFGQYLAAT